MCNIGMTKKKALSDKRILLNHAVARYAIAINIIAMYCKCTRTRAGEYLYIKLGNIPRGSKDAARDPSLKFSG